MQDTQNDDLTVATTTEPAEPDTDELHAEQDDEPEQPGQQAEQQQPEPEQPKPARNPRPSRRGDKQPPAPAPAPAEPEQTAPAPEPVGAEVAPKRGRGRPKKAEQPAKKAPAAGADVNPQRSAQVDAIKGLLQLRASKIASLACMVVGWEALNQEEELLVDAEFEGWSPPPEARKAVVLAVVALPRALADNRIRQLVGLPSVGGGDAAAQRAAELQAQQQQAMRAAQVPVVVDAAPVEAPPAPAPAAPAPAPAPTGEQLATSPLFAGQTVKVPKGFV